MKKIFLLILLIPFIVNAKSNINAHIECQEELKINSKVNCNLIIDNPNSEKIQSVTFNNNASLLDVKSSFDLELNEEIYSVNLDVRTAKIILLNFNYLIEKNNSTIKIENLNIVANENITLNLNKNLKIDNIAHVDNILINNQPIVNFSKDVFNYNVNLYEKHDYIEIKIITDEKNRVEETIKLTRYIPSYNFEVKNDYDSQTYSITFNYANKEDDKIEIKEIPFSFDSSKKYYYLEVENNVSKININVNDNIKSYNLSIGKNKIYLKDQTYLFVINRLKPNEIVNTNSKIKSLKFGNNYINVSNDNYNYNHIANNIEALTIEPFYSQDYEIKYDSRKIQIIVYDAKLDQTTYNINIIKDKEETAEIKEYDRSKSVIIFLIFLSLFLLLSIVVIKKHKKGTI